MGRYFSGVLCIILTSMAAELFLPSLAGGTSPDPGETGDWRVRILQEQVEEVMPLYEIARYETALQEAYPGEAETKDGEGRRAAEDDSGQREVEDDSGQREVETIRLLTLEEADEHGQKHEEIKQITYPENGSAEETPEEVTKEAEKETEKQEEKAEEGGKQETPEEAETAEGPVESEELHLAVGRRQELELDAYASYEELVKNFYTIDRNTVADEGQLKVEKLAARDLRLDEESDSPQILIYHTHSQEGYADSVPGDASTTVVGVGDYLTQILEEQYGYQVMHCTEQFDLENRNQAYNKALPVLEQILQENPSIRVMIDLHRDEMPAGTRLVTEVDGVTMARFMFFNGLSRTRSTGNIGYLKNENLDGNLAFSFQMQVKCMEYYPGLTRKIYLKGYRYNLHLRERSLLVEMGAQNNTVEEAMNACGPLAHALHLVLSGE